MPKLPITDLPVESVIGALAEALGEAGAAVLSAEPGAGKTTLVPLRLLDEAWLGGNRIVVLEPRRIAARAAARRMASMLGEQVGDTVGYRTRDERRVGPRTRIEVVTEGLLTRRLQQDPELAGVGLLIFDELHERTLHSDVALALALEAKAALRPDLRIIAMSATIDTERVAALIGEDGPAPVLAAPGRLHDVAIVWDPPRSGERLEDAVARIASNVLAAESGDVLCFLPGAREIRRVARLLASRVGAETDVRPLFGALDAQAQDRAIEPSPAGRRKVVLSTDIAETSLTVEGVRVVLDAGRSRVSVHDPARGMSRLETVTASQASATQRAGRAGRLEAGLAIRLWSEATHHQRTPFDAPEISSTDLSAFVLEAAAWGSAAEDLPLLDAPSGAHLSAARRMLVDLGLLDGRGRITALGRDAVTMPLHPRLAALVASAVAEGDGWLGCLVAAALEERDILQGRPEELPADLGVRILLIADRGRAHARLNDGARAHAARRARALAGRLGVRAQSAGFDLDRLGIRLLSGYPDRVGRRRSGRGRFLLASGAGATVPGPDPLASEEYIVAVDLDGNRNEARIRIGAGVDRSAIETTLEHRIVAREELTWDNDRAGLYNIVERRLGAVVLGRSHERATPSPASFLLMLDQVRTLGLEVFDWSAAATSLRDRVAFARSAGDLSWPEVSDAALLDELEQWLGPLLHDAVNKRDLAQLDLYQALWSWLGWHRRSELDRLMPRRVLLPSGREVEVDYGRERPTVSGRVQDFYGASEGPTIVDGRFRLTLELLSPADRPVQVTSDLGGFWAGSWVEVRKEMAGRYPKHRWPDDPASARPGR